MTCSPQRFLANNRNVLRTASLVPSSVLPVENKVLTIPFARRGTAQALLTGSYTGFEQADYEFEILDLDVDDARVSKPTFNGAGSGTLESITASGAPQTYTVECSNAGIQGAAAAVTIDGSVIKAAADGVAGNALEITVDQSGLINTDANRTTLVDIAPGAGGPTSPMIGEGFDWDAAQLSKDANGVATIPLSAHRIAFADNPGSVHLQYKDFIDGAWQYFLIPALTRTVPKGTRIQFVTGGRTVTISTTLPTPAVEISPADSIVTDYDFLIWIRTTSELVVVDSVVANDRSPTGQASREFALHTDAHAQVSTGSGSKYATGFTDVTVASDAATQLVTAECFAVTAADHPNARLGSELWQLKSSILGTIGTIATGDPYSGAQFGLTIPVKLPPSIGEDKGTIGAKVEYVARADNEVEPMICVAGLRLGGDASDKTVTFKYAPAPAGDCNCTRMPAPHLSESCLGVPSEGSSVSYEDDTNARLVALRLWKKTMVRELTTLGSDTVSATEAPVLSRPLDGVAGSPAVGYPLVADDGSSVTAAASTINTGTGDTTAYRAVAQGTIADARTTPAGAAQYAAATESLNVIINDYEACIAQIDPLPVSSPPGYREAGMDAWDDAVTELQTDFEAAVGAGSPFARLLNLPSSRYDAALDHALASAGIAVVGKTDAGTVAGDGCWRDWGGPRWIDVDGVYAPIWTNHPFYFVRRSVDGDYFSTHEAGGQVNVAEACIVHLKFGDTITFTIGGAGHGSTYQNGDTLELPIVGAGPLSLTGGVDDAPVQTWNVNGNLPFPAYSFNPDSPAAYSGTVGGDSVGFLLTEGGIPFAKGDRFRFAVEGGHLRWRKDGGAWDGSSPPIPIPVAPLVIDEGLSLSFTAGATASFAIGDVFKFRALQPWAVSNSQRPTASRWKWDGDDATLESGDLGAIAQIDMFAMVHGLPVGSTAVLWGGNDNTATDWSEPLTYRAGTIWKAMDRQAQYLRLEITDAPDGWIRWVWAGVPVTTSLSAEIDLSYDFLVNEPGGNLQGGRFVGEAVSGEASWTEAALDETDAADLVAMLRHVMSNNKEPFILIPQVTRPDAHFVMVSSKSIPFADHMAYNQDVAIGRRVSARIPFEGVWQ